MRDHVIPAFTSILKVSATVIIAVSILVIWTIIYHLRSDAKEAAIRTCENSIRAHQFRGALTAICEATNANCPPPVTEFELLECRR